MVEWRPLAVTRLSSQLSAIEAVNACVDGYLTKPFRAIEPLMAAARAWNQK